MTHATNALGQPISPPVTGWQPPPWPPRAPADGRVCRLEPLDAARHAADLFAAFAEDRDGRMWTYLSYGPFASAGEYAAWLTARASGDDPLFYAIVERASGRALGVAAYMRIFPDDGSIEIGSLAFSPRLQRTRMATEALALMIRRAFALGYRRCEWKCATLNTASRRAAERLGFAYEGTFRQATVLKGWSRDTAWFSITDGEWPALDAAYARWLDDANFDPAGSQRESLSDLTRRAPAAVREPAIG